MTARAIETRSEQLLAEFEDGVATLTMNRPERRNALTDEMLEALAGALGWCEADPAVRCIVLTGADGAFCAGGDVKSFAEGSGANPATPAHEAIELQQRLQRGTAGRLAQMPKPTIACVDGAAAGAGLGLALSCDFRVASERAVLVTAFARVGLCGDYGVTWFLTRMLGRSRALELMFFSERIDGRRAEQLGLVDRFTGEKHALVEAQRVAKVLAAGPAVAQHAIKRLVDQALDADLLSCMDLEVIESTRCAATEDHAAAVAAFAEHKAPMFHGR